MENYFIFVSLLSFKENCRLCNMNFHQPLFFAIVNASIAVLLVIVHVGVIVVLSITVVVVAVAAAVVVVAITVML